jgi:cell division inhibitor SepF
MGLGDVWNRTLVYFGIAEEDDEWDDDGYATEERLERSHRDRPNVRRLSPRRRGDFDDWTEAPEPSASAERTTTVRPARLRSVEPVAGAPSVRVHLVLPRSFNDAQQIADKFKDAIPVILNLQA